MSDTKMLPVDPATISGLKTVLDNAPYVRSGLSTTRIFGVSMVLNITSRYATVLTGSQVADLFGRPPIWENGDFAVVINGDERIGGNFNIDTMLNPETGSVDIRIYKEGSHDEPNHGSTRLNVFLVAM